MSTGKIAVISILELDNGYASATMNNFIVSRDFIEYAAFFYKKRISVLLFLF